MLNIGSLKSSFLYKGDELIYPNPIKDGLVLWYDFAGMKNDSVNKDVAKDLTKNIDGNLYNFSYDNNSGYYDGLNLDGIDDFISIEKDYDTLYNLKTLTLEVTINFKESPDFWRWIIGNSVDSAGSKGYSLAISPRSSQGISFIMGGSTVSSGITPIENEKYHIIATINNDKSMRLIINGGQKINNNVMTKDPIPSSLAFSIGKATYYESPFLRSELYNIRVYDRPLTEEEIQHNYQLEKERWGI